MQANLPISQGHVTNESGQAQRDAEVTRLQTGQKELVRRLDAGAEKVLAAKATGAANAAALEDFWLVLLAQYEATFDRLAALGETC